ncbi:MAG: Blue-light-activated protein [Syntrophorhabdus sp. PtaU1.Bin002]|nr:MAG: Blue-light-activated protein [Syntrophorhabdus sp. PtaU1.Bin002]
MADHPNKQIEADIAIDVPPPARSDSAALFPHTHQREDTALAQPDRLRQRIAYLEQWQVDHQKIEEDIKNSEERYRSLVETSQDLIFQCDPRGCFTFLNKAWEETLGYKVSDLLGRRITDLRVPAAARRDTQILSRILAHGTVTGYETTHLSKSGTLVHLLFNFTVLHNKQGAITGIQGSGRNLTDRKKLEQEQLRLQKLQAIGTLAGGIAHDFNNLLQAILGNIQLAKRSLSPSDKPFAWLTSAEKAGDQAKDLSYRLLTFAQGGEPIKQATFINNLLADTVALALSGSTISVEFSLADNLYPVEIDEGQIKQVISNIVINAKEVMSKGGHLTVTAHNLPASEARNSSLLRNRDFVHITFEDQGIGIPPRNLSRVFDPYFTTKGMGSDRGRGLGLTICHAIVTRHNGLITVDSTLGVRTTVNIYLPAAQKAPPATPSCVLAPSPKTRARLLLMDDEELVRDVTREMLEQIGYQVELACDGDEAIDLYVNSLNHGQSFDAIILDLTIPGGTGGDEAILRLTAIDPNVKGILSTGYADSTAMKDFKEYGFKGTISKPFKIEDLANIIARVINQ